MAEQFESGWENPDHHPSLEQRARPMFDKDGKPVDAAPEPEPLTAAELAMFEAVATGVIVGEATERRGWSIGPDYPVGIKAGEVVTAEKMNAAIEARMARIRELATRALDNPSPAAWAVALTEILRELDA